jgi:hypothetical protein
MSSGEEPRQPVMSSVQFSSVTQSNTNVATSKHHLTPIISRERRPKRRKDARPGPVLAHHYLYRAMLFHLSQKVK